MTIKKTLKEHLASSAQKKFLFLGREALFSKAEIARFLKKYHITMTQNYEEEVVVCIEHSRLNPVEEEISNEVYDAKVPSFSLEVFERLLSSGINEDELLMGIKLSGDQERIFRLLGNTDISESLFIKLLMMYRWHDEEEDNREDRDTIMHTLKRYIDIKPNEADLLYSYLTLRRLATEAINPHLLLALIGFPNFVFLIRGKEKVTLHETIARNSYLDKEVIAKLISLREHKVDIALASNPCVGLDLLRTLLDKQSSAIDQALCSNQSIDDTLFFALLDKDDTSVQLLLLSQPISLSRLNEIEKRALSLEIFATVGANENLDYEVIEKLRIQNDEGLLCHLSANSTLDSSQLKKIYLKSITATFAHLAINPSTSIEMLEMFYHDYDDVEIYKALAHNRSTPIVILRALFDKHDFALQQSMASNGSIPLDLLDILKVDTRLQNELAQNPILIKGYETVLDYDKKAVQF